MNQKGLTPPIVLFVAAIGLIAFFVIASATPFKDDLYNRLFPKPSSEASEVQPTTTIVGKIIGATKPVDTQLNIPVFNPTFKAVTGTDLGASTLYKGKLYIAIGDTYIQGQGWTPSTGSFFVPFVDNYDAINFDNGFVLSGYVNTGASEARAKKAIVSSTNDIPNALFTINHGGQELMFSQYMVADSGNSFVGNAHHAAYSGFAKYDDATDKFIPYKTSTYKWLGSWRHFGMASLIPDTSSGYLYMVGSPVGRFGGVKLARIQIAAFVDPNNTQNWEYYLGNDQWSAPTIDPNIIKTAAWLISPKDPNWTVEKDYSTVDYNEQCRLLTISEFSVVYNPYLGKYILLTGTSCGAAGVYYYTAPSLTGPWSEQKLLVGSNIRGHEWNQYGTYTSPALLKENGRIMYFTATTWYQNYTVYLYKTDFGAIQTPTPTPTPIPTPTPTTTPTPVTRHTISGYVYKDDNGNNTREDGEGLIGATVTIANSNGTRVGSLNTSPEGYYILRNLADSNYTVTLTKPDPLPSGRTLSSRTVSASLRGADLTKDFRLVPSVPTPNLLVNGDFETILPATPTRVASWLCEGAVSGICQLDRTEKRPGSTGSYSTKVTNTGGSWGWQVTRRSIPAQAGDKFCLSAWVKKQKVNDATFIAIQEVQDDWESLGLGASDTTAWQLVRGTLTRPSSWDTAIIQVYLRSWSNSSAWFDDVSLTRGACQ